MKDGFSCPTVTLLTGQSREVAEAHLGSDLVMIQSYPISPDPLD